jgi:glutaredoxin 3
MMTEQQNPDHGNQEREARQSTEVVMYWRPGCPYCMAAEHLLRHKGIEPVMLRIDTDPKLRTEMINKSGGRTTVPQIFINGRHVGGCDDLHALEDRGALEPLLGKTP